MSRIIRFEDNKYFDLDMHTLFIDDKEVGKPLKGIPFRILELLAGSAPMRFDKDKIQDKCWSEVKQYATGERVGSVPYHISKLRAAIHDEVIQGTREYKYIKECDGLYYCAYKIESLEIGCPSYIAQNSVNLSYDAVFGPNGHLRSFLDEAASIENQFINAILSCDCKWGSCTYDTEMQNTNTCEGILALLMSSKNESYRSVIEQAVEYLYKTCESEGLTSKSLSEATVVPTSMFLYLCNSFGFNNDVKLMEVLAEKLWMARDTKGWGLYVRKMQRNSNIGCTFWAAMGLATDERTKSDEFQKLICGLFNYEDTRYFGRNIDDVNPPIPCVYATSMMFILYSMLTETNKNIVERKYNWRESLKYISKNFDNPFLLVEEEGITGVEISGKTNVHTVNWNHMSINYSLQAISIGINNHLFSIEEVVDIMERVKKVLVDNSVKEKNSLFWHGPRMTLEKGSRGKLIFPTMHSLMGLSSFCRSIELLLEENAYEQ